MSEESVGRVRTGFEVRPRCSISVVRLKQGSGLCLQLLKCPYLFWLESIPSEQWKHYQLGCPREISSICGYKQANISQSKFLFWDHGIWIAFWGPWCSQHLVVVCLKFHFGPALGSDKRGRAWCYTEGGCLAWKLEHWLVAGSCALSQSYMWGRRHFLGAPGLQAAQMSRFLLVSEVSKRFMSFLSRDAYKYHLWFFWGGAAELLKSW